MRQGRPPVLIDAGALQAGLYMCTTLCDGAELLAVTWAPQAYVRGGGRWRVDRDAGTAEGPLTILSGEAGEVGVPPDAADASADLKLEAWPAQRRPAHRRPPYPESV